MQATWTIQIDKREKRPLVFPRTLKIWSRNTPPWAPRTTRVRIQTESVTLPTADYRLKSHPDVCLIERKASADELFNNLVTRTGRRAFLAECERLKVECSRPVLFLESDPVSFSKTPYSGGDPAAIRDLLLQLLSEYRIELFVLPCTRSAQRALAAEWIAATLIASAQGTPPTAAHTET